MFGQTSLVFKRAVPAYGMFMIQQKNNALLTSCKTISARGKATARLYAKLSKKEKAALAAEGIKRSKKSKK
jgi:hypothetical protein